MKQLWLFTAIILIFSTCSACTAVAPWERGNLAKPQMALEPHPEFNQLRGHHYSSREGTAGLAFSHGGGGCGCF